MSSKLNIVTGAFSYTGRYISKILQERGEKVRNLTNHPSRPIPKDFLDKSKVDTYLLPYDNVDELTKVMEGGDTLYCTYWVRFNEYKGQTRDLVIQRGKNIITAAKKANIKKIIYTSHTQTQKDSPFGYIQGKYQMEEFIKESGISYGIAKPCMLFGNTANESIVINNLAYVLKRIPIFPIVGDGRYPIQPVHVQDLAELCVEMAQNQKQNFEKDAVGDEIYSFINFVKKISKTIQSRNVIIPGFSTEIAYNLSKPLNFILKDKFIEKDDLDLLKNNYLYSNFPATGKRSLEKWLEENKLTLG